MVWLKYSFDGSLLLYIVALSIFFVTGWLTRSDEYGVSSKKDEARSQLIKYKAIVSSWVLLISFFVINFVFDFFNLNDERLAILPFKYPELLYLFIAIISYFIFYWIYRRKMSANEK